MLPATISDKKSFVSDQKSHVFYQSMKLRTTDLLACKWGKISDPYNSFHF